MGFSNKCTFYNKLDTFWGGAPQAARNSSREEPQEVILSTLADGFLPFEGWKLKELWERVLSRIYHIPFLSMECEYLLEKFLILDPNKRGPSEQTVKHPWITVGHGYEELKLYLEPLADFQDPGQTEFMASMVTRGDRDPGLTDRPERQGNVPISAPGL